MIHEINQLTGEWVWHPAEGYPQEPTHRDQKDLGLDVLLWKRIPDQRKGMCFYIGQCACGLTDWDTKFKEPDIPYLSCWINPISAVPPAKFFSVPFHIPNDTYFTEVNWRAGLTLDRTRITLLAEQPSNRDFIVQQAKERYKDLIGLVLNS